MEIEKKRDLCIVHIGMPKTGSSSIQESFFSGISDKKISYANLHEANHSIALYGMFTENPETYHIFSKKGWKTKEISAFNTKNKELLIDGFLNHVSPIEIISGEDIYHLSEDAVLKMKLFLTNYFQKIIIIAYVRPPKSFMESAFQQLVKHNDLGTFNFNCIYHPYKNLEKFDNIFGKENVRLWKFDPTQFPNGDIFFDFCQKIGINFDKSKSNKANESISQEAVSMLFTYHYFGNKTDFGYSEYLLEHALINLFRSVGDTKFRFSQSLIESVLSKYHDDYSWIKSRMDDSLHEKYESTDSTIGSEEELLNFSIKMITYLEQLIGKEYLPTELFGNTPRDVAKLVDILKIKLANKLGIRKNETLSEQEHKEYNILKKFDINWNSYYVINKIEDKSSDPILHYLKNWNKINLIIENEFDTFYYLEKYPDIKKANINPLIHYFRHGIKEGRKGMEKK